MPRHRSSEKCHMLCRKALSVRTANKQSPQPTRRDRVRALSWKVFQRCIELLREIVPPAFPVDVQVTRVSRRCEGDCGREGQRFRIRISNRLTESAAIDVLLHEWAHALAWNYRLDKLSRSQSRSSEQEFDLLAHGSEWGCAYSRVYQAFINEIHPRLQAFSLNARNGIYV